MTAATGARCPNGHGAVVEDGWTEAGPLPDPDVVSASVDRSGAHAMPDNSDADGYWGPPGPSDGILALIGWLRR